MTLPLVQHLHAIFRAVATVATINVIMNDCHYSNNVSAATNVFI